MYRMKIIIIGLNWLGDVIMSLPAIAAVSRKAETHIVTRPHLKEVYDLSGLSLHVHCVQSKNGFFETIKETRKLRALSADCVLVFPDSLRAAMVSKMCGAKHAIGYKSQFRNIFLDNNVVKPENYKEIHESKLYCGLAKEIGITDFDYTFNPKKFEKVFFENTCEKAGILPQKPYIIIAPGAAFGAAKRWPPEKFAEVAKLIRKHEPEKQIIITAGNNEKAIADEISKLLPENTFINAVGKTSITELGCLLSQCSLLLANDSGTMHLAALYQTPTVVPVGPTDMTRTGALNINFRPVISDACEKIPCRKRVCPLKTHACMQSISASDIYNVSAELRKISKPY